MRGGDLGNESIDVGGYHIARSFEIDHKIPDSILGEKSNWWAELRAVRKHRRKSNRAARPGETKPDGGRGDGKAELGAKVTHDCTNI